MRINLGRIAALSRWAATEEELTAQVYDGLSAMRPEGAVVLGWPDEENHRVMFVFVEGGRAFLGSFSLPQGQKEPVISVEDNALPFTTAGEFLKRLRDVRRAAGASRDEVFIDRDGTKVRLDEPTVRDLLDKAGMAI